MAIIIWYILSMVIWSVVGAIFGELAKVILNVEITGKLIAKQLYRWIPFPFGMLYLAIAIRIFQ
jgi:hypothetical protein